LTGGNRGIGSAIKDIFIKNGDDVISPSRNEIDLNSIEFVENDCKSINKEIDVIINNAGVNYISSIDDISNTNVGEMINVNVLSPLYLCKNLIDGMKRKNWGRIVNISSIFGTLSKPSRVVYSTTKAAIQGMTRGLALDLAKYNILVNSVSPGYVITDMTYKNNSVKDIRKITANIPLQRLAQKSEIAELVYFLCSDKNTYITGQNIIIDGGFSIW
jgi:3-oxoacyl-[acyl-carrier protein] reductase